MKKLRILKLGKFLALATTVLGLVVLAFGALLTTPTSQTLLSLQGVVVPSDGDRTFLIPLVVRPSAQVSVTISSSGVVAFSMVDSGNVLLAAGAGQLSYAQKMTPSYDTIAQITISNTGTSAVTLTINALETYTAVNGYLGIAAGVGLLLSGIAILLLKEERAVPAVK